MADDSRKSSGDPSPQWVQELVLKRRKRLWQPATDAYESAEHFVVTVEVAGMKATDFNVSLVDQHLVISGTRRRPANRHSTAYHQMEVLYGDFRTELHLPWAVERDKITATYEDGFLVITLPRRRQARSIPIVKTEKQGN